MIDITGNGKAVMTAEIGTVQEGDFVLTDLVMEDLDVQLSPLLQDETEGTANARAIAYRDRILEAADRSEKTRKV